MDERDLGAEAPRTRATSTRRHSTTRQWRAGAALVVAALLDSICCPAGGALLSLGTGAAVLSVAVGHGSQRGGMASAWNGSGELAVASGGQLHLLENGGATHVLGGPGVVSQPSWSADGKWVAFLRTPAPPPAKPWTTENSALWVARANGDDAHPLSAPNGDVTQFSWGPGSGGEKMAFSVSYSPQYTSRIFLAAPVTAPARVFASFDELIDFSFAPDGNTLAVSYRTSPGAGFKGVLELAPLSGATPRTVYTMPQGGYVELASWWPNAKGPNPEGPNPEGPNPEGPNPEGLVFWSDPVGSASIAADGLSLDSLDFATGKATNLATTLTYANWLAWSPNGRTLAVVDGGDRSIWGSGKRVELCAVPAATCHAAPLPAGQVISLEPAWTASGSLLFVVAPGTKAATIGPPPDAPANGTGPYSNKNVAAWYDAQQVYSLGTGSSSPALVAATGRGAHTPTATPDGLLYVRDGRLWYLPTGSAAPSAVASGLQSPSPYGNYYGYIDWSEDYAWHQ